MKCAISALASTTWHFGSTCKMGAASVPMSVVDADLRFRGLSRLRVIDASIMPRVVGGNTNAAAIMIGEKGADLILQSWRQPNSAKDSKTADKDEL